MKIFLQSHCIVEQIKQEFSNTYPFLKICFFTKKQESRGTLAEEVHPSTQLIVASNVFKEGDTSINQTDTIKDAERKFEDQYGVTAHIYRKQNGAWMDTRITDDLTLQEQNTWGRESSKPLKTKPE